MSMRKQEGLEALMTLQSLQVSPAWVASLTSLVKETGDDFVWPGTSLHFTSEICQQFPTFAKHHRYWFSSDDQ